MAYKKRKDGLFRKLQEFTTLCDVKACVIIYGPKQENGPHVEPDIWPKDNPDHVLGMIDTYKAKKRESGNKTFGLNDFFHERKKKIEEEISKLRKKNREAKYPTSLTMEMQKWNEGQLRQFAAELGQKAENVKAKIEILKGLPQNANNNLMHFGNARLNGQLYPPPPAIPIHYPNTIEHHPQLQYPINQNSMMMLLMNGGDQFGIGGGPSQIRSQVFYEAGSSSVVDPMICHDTRALACYYRQPPLPPLGYMVAPPGWENRDGGGSYEDVVQYLMKNE